MSRIAADERRELLLVAALRVIAREGVSGATTRAIVAEAEMSLASFHYAFHSHADMMRDLVKHVVDAESGAAFTAVRPGAEIEETLRAGLQAYLDYIAADPEHELALQELVQFALRTPGLEPLAREQYAAYRAAVTGVLREAAAAARVEWSRPIDEVARLVIVITDGVTLAWLVDRDDAAARRAIDFAATSLATLTRPGRAQPTPPAVAVAPALAAPTPTAESTGTARPTARPTVGAASGTAR